MFKMEQCNHQPTTEYQCKISTDNNEQRGCMQAVTDFIRYKKAQEIISTNNWSLHEDLY